MTPRPQAHIANFSRPYCLAIPIRDLSTKKIEQNIEKMTRKPRSHVRILIYRTWAIPNAQSNLN